MRAWPCLLLLLPSVLAGCTADAPPESRSVVALGVDRLFPGGVAGIELDAQALSGSPALEKLRRALDEVVDGFEPAVGQLTPAEGDEVARFLQARWEAQRGEAPRPDPTPVRYRGADLAISLTPAQAD